jgi:hypothetical protein
MKDFYRSLRLSPKVSGREVVKAAARALHPMLRANPGLRLLRRRYYREMLNLHDEMRAQVGTKRSRATAASPLSPK